VASSAESLEPTVPFNDLSRTTPELAGQIADAVARVIASGWFVLGPEHDAFEQELGAYVGVEHAVALGNGTDALELSLSALGVSAGDTVMTVANAGGYTSVATRLLGAEPVYADVSPETLLLSVDTATAALDALPRAPKVLVVTHLYGAMAPIADLVELAHSRGIAVIEDVAQAIGARAGGKAAGTFGDIGTTSFYPTKNLGALGDGGAVVTSNAELAEAVRSLRQYGWTSKYRIGRARGRNSRLDELQAAILRVKLPHLNAMNERRRAIHSRYEEASSGALRIVNRSSESFIGHLAVGVAADRDAARAAFDVAGVRTDVHYPIPDHRQPWPGPAAIDLPATDAASASVVSLPMFPELTDAEVDRVVAALRTIGGTA
jgi:dTDP-4-amino-4,6-dideoxygalactose transaminase